MFPESDMDRESIFKKISNALQAANRTAAADYIHLFKKNETAYEIVISRAFHEGSVPVSPEKIDTADMSVDKTGFKLSTITSESGNIHCVIIPFSGSNEEFLLIQGSKEFSNAALDLFTLLAQMIKISAPSDGTGGDTADAEKYKNQLIRMREMQARLFPKFNTVKGLDIASVFLPADLMSGNFVDGFYLDDSTYQITTCIVSGYDAASSFAGAAIRTLVRSEGTRKMVPSLLIETIMNKLKNIVSGIHAIIYLSIYQINVNTGRIILSSFGDATTIFYNSKKKGYMNLKNTEVGKLLAKRNFFRDISLVLEPGDIMLYYSNGAVNLSTDDGSMQYGEARLVEELLKIRDESSLEIVHGLSQSLFEFSNYKPNPEDILLVSLRRSV